MLELRQNIQKPKLKTKAGSNTPVVHNTAHTIQHTQFNNVPTSFRQASLT